MQCKICGASLLPDSVFCPVCGEEVQLITEDEAFEDALLEAVLREDGEQELPAGPTDPQEPERPVPGNGHRRRRKIVSLVVFLAALAAAAVIVVSYAANHSESWLMDRANSCYASHDYTHAADYLDRLLVLDPDHAEALLMRAKICLSAGDLEQGEQLINRFLAIKPESRSGYRVLLEILTAGDRYDEILARSKTINDPKLLEVFDEYMTSMPEASLPGGTYTERLEVRLTIPEGCTVYYTLDGTVPGTAKEKYDKKQPLQLNEEGEYILSAVSIDGKGRESRVMKAVYRLTFPDAELPVVSPEGGEFEEEAYITIQTEDGASAYYAWDEGPDISHNKYTGPIAVPEGNHVLQVIAVNEFGKISGIVKYNYIYYPPPEPEEEEPEEADQKEESEKTDGEKEEKEQKEKEKKDQPSEETEQTENGKEETESGKTEDKEHAEENDSPADDASQTQQTADEAGQKQAAEDSPEEE